MPKGHRFRAERRSFRDPRTGTRITQLTDYKGHSYPLYFTNSGWWDGGRRLVFGSDRGGRSDLYSLELTSGEITRLTDRGQPPPPAETSLLFASLNPRRDELYFWYGRTLFALELNSLAERPLYTAPEGFATNMTSVTADGKYVCTGLYEDLSSRFPVDLLRGYVGFREYRQAHPRSRVVRIDTETERAETLLEEACWIGHVRRSRSCSATATRGLGMRSITASGALTPRRAKAGLSTRRGAVRTSGTSTGSPTANTSVITVRPGAEPPFSAACASTTPGTRRARFPTPPGTSTATT